MPPPPQLRGVIRFQRVHDAGHGVDGVAAQFGPGAVGGFAVSFQPEPERALVGGDNLKPRWLADNREVGRQTAGGKGARTGLRIFLVHQSGKDEFRRLRTGLRTGQFAQRCKHGGHGTLGVARTPARQAAIFCERDELAFPGGWHGVEMRREQDAPADFSRRRQPGDQIGATG